MTEAYPMKMTVRLTYTLRRYSQSLIHSLTHPPLHSLTHPLINTPTAHPLIHSLTPLTNPPSHNTPTTAVGTIDLIHSLTHPLMTHPFINTPTTAVGTIDAFTDLIHSLTPPLVTPPLITVHNSRRDHRCFYRPHTLTTPPLTTHPFINTPTTAVGTIDASTDLIHSLTHPLITVHNSRGYH